MIKNKKGRPKIERQFKTCKCGKNFECRITENRKYCSLICWYKFGDRTKENNPAWKERETHYCQCGCNEIFETIITSKRRFINGHQMRGIKRSDVTRAKLREAAKGRFTLKWYIERYGENEGERKYIERNKKTVSNNLEALTAKYGKVVAKEKFDNYLKKWKRQYTEEFWIEKFGEKIGKEKYIKRMNKLFPNCSSKISQELFFKLYNKLNLSKYKYVYFDKLNHEFSCGTRYNFDFVINDIKKIIEFNGDKFHANPSIYKAEDVSNPFEKLTAKEIWENDSIKINKVLNKGYKVLVIWESDYYKNKEKTFKKCKEFLEE